MRCLSKPKTIWIANRYLFYNLVKGCNAATCNFSVFPAKLATNQTTIYRRLPDFNGKFRQLVVQYYKVFPGKLLFLLRFKLIGNRGGNDWLKAGAFTVATDQSKNRQIKGNEKTPKCSTTQYLGS